ncbi:MAG: rod-binding protein [Magnetococcales bacterium]|nr:rod-binding protein [Magnetococcales bacterium]
MTSPVGLDPQTLPRTGTAKKVTSLSPRDEQRLRAASADFEALFIKQMLSSMRKTIPKDPQGEGLVRESQGEKIFRDMLDSEYATMMSHRKGGGGMGLGEMMFQQLVKRYQLQAGQANESRPTKVAENALQKLQVEGNAMQAVQSGPKSASNSVGK